MKATVVFLFALAQAGGAQMLLDHLGHKTSKLADGFPQWTDVSAVAMQERALKTSA